MDIVAEIPATDDFNSDYSKLLKNLEVSKPCYILLNTFYISSHLYKNPSSLENSVHQTKWINVLYVPDSSMVRDKMIYSSSRSNLISIIGSGNYKSSIFATHSSELSLEEISSFFHESNSGIKSVADVEPQVINPDSEMNGLSHRTTSISNLSIELDSAAKESLHSLHVGKLYLIVLKINPSTQVIELDGSSDDIKQCNDISSLFPVDEPRFGYFLYKYESPQLPSASLQVHRLADIEEGCYQVPIFIYCCPEDSNIKLKMIYSTTKTSLLNLIHSNVGLVEKLRIEVNNNADLTMDLILERLNSLKVSSTANSNASSSYQTSGFSFDDNPMLNKPILGKSNGRFTKPSAPGRKK
ncbi:Twinfilin-1 [Smittium mucronatum]|uniref:Twinfilin-1 n=1 Tax=Smittium mucronatum TaxID=133383 RepID=A0A1R0H5M7_9FUNG|nr:Twinfilin-1 [Smittium mucronatum]